jgi:hypothetical protein
MNLDGDARETPVVLHAMWKTPQTSSRASSSPSPPLSAVSFPTRGWASPGGSVIDGSVLSAPTARYPQGPILPKYWERWRVSNIPLPRITNVSGKHILVKGVIVLYVQLGTTVHRVRFHVAPYLPVPYILG